VHHCDVCHHLSDVIGHHLRVAKESPHLLAILRILWGTRRRLPVCSSDEGSPGRLGSDRAIRRVHVHHVRVALRHAAEVPVRPPEQGVHEMDPEPGPEPGHRARARDRPHLHGAGDGRAGHLLPLRHQPAGVPPGAGLRVRQVRAGAVRAHGRAVPHRADRPQGVPHVPVHRQVRVQGRAEGRRELREQPGDEHRPVHPDGGRGVGLVGDGEELRVVDGGQDGGRAHHRHDGDRAGDDGLRRGRGRHVPVQEQQVGDAPEPAVHLRAGVRRHRQPAAEEGAVPDRRGGADRAAGEGRAVRPPGGQGGRRGLHHRPLVREGEEELQFPQDVRHQLRLLLPPEELQGAVGDAAHPPHQPHRGRHDLLRVSVTQAACPQSQSSTGGFSFSFG
jgi:hypothetical protein